jgi:phosphoglycolate phosphatase-like HAD superfamily hydrolase
MPLARTVIFDFDGTLVDSLEVGFRACNAVGPRFGVRTVGRAEADTFREMSTREMFDHLGVPLRKVPGLVLAVREEMARVMPSVPLFDGIADCLHQLRESGVELGVVSSNSRQNVRSCLGQNGVLARFEFVHTALNLFGKHRTLGHVLRTRGLAAGRVAYVGDEGRDVEAARRCRVTGVAVTWGSKSRAQLGQHHPDHIVDSPRELTRLLLGDPGAGCVSSQPA